MIKEPGLPPVVTAFRPLSLDIRHLRLVTAIVDEGSLTRAAERLNVTQSALSHQLKDIEISLGVSLFVRTKKRLVPTAAGEELVARARPIMNDLLALEDDLRRRASGWRGTLRLATECYTLYEWFPPILRRFHRQHRNIEVDIVADATDNAGGALLRGDIDLAIVSMLAPTPSMTMHRLFTDEMLLLVANDHKLATKSHVTPADIANERLLLFTPPERNWFYQQFFGDAMKPREVQVLKLTEAILSMVRAGLGVTAAARWAVADELRTRRVTGVRIGRNGYYRDWHAATLVQRKRPVPGYVTDFIELLSTTALPVRFDERVTA